MKQEQAPRDLDGQEHEQVGSRLHVAIVDDHRGIREGYRQMFPLVFSEKDSFSMFEDGQEAWEWFQQNPGKADLLWTDNSMPRMTGSELLRRLHDQTPSLNPHLTTALVTSEADEYQNLSSEELARRGITMVVDKNTDNIFASFKKARENVIAERESMVTG